jgi:hypothetical protein
MQFPVQLSEEDIGTLQAAVENLRAPERTESIIAAAWRIAYRLEQLAKRAEAARRENENVARR